MSFYDKAKKLLYQHVDVVTNIKKSSDFKSEFICQSCELENCDNLTDAKQLIFSGYLKAIDPLSKSTILCLISNCRNPQITSNLLILGHTISDIRFSIYIQSDNLDPGSVQELIESDGQAKLAKHPYFYRAETEHTLSQEELVDIQNRIIAWLEKYRIPVELHESSAELIVANSVRIKPPYNHESDYICPTRIVLQRVKRIVDSRPLKHDQKTELE